MAECTCDVTEEAHSCPYAEEIRGVDDDEYCTCCPECEYQCAMDI
jgi:hypothetical protein